MAVYNDKVFQAKIGNRNVLSAFRLYDEDIPCFSESNSNWDDDILIEGIISKQV